MSPLENWIEKLNTYLGFEKWNSTLAVSIQDYLNHKEFTAQSVDALLMQVTKSVEASLREAVAQFTAATVPAEASFGPNLLNYAKNKGFIPEPKRGSDALYALIYWYFEKPRNTTHHSFTGFPLTTIVMFISTANFILNEIQRLSQEQNYYDAKTIINFNATSSQLYISVADIKKEDETVMPTMLEMNLINPEKAIKIYPLAYSGGSWTVQASTQQLMRGTYSVQLAGCMNQERFCISGSTIVVI